MAGVCRGPERRRIGLVNLPLSSPPPAGVQWMAVRRHWAHDSSAAQALSDDPPPRATPTAHESNLAGLLHLRENLLDELGAGRREQSRHLG
jgi:hypothetical protein